MGSILRWILARLDLGREFKRAYTRSVWGWAMSVLRSKLRARDGTFSFADRLYAQEEVVCVARVCGIAFVEAFVCEGDHFVTGV